MYLWRDSYVARDSGTHGQSEFNLAGTTREEAHTE